MLAEVDLPADLGPGDAKVRKIEALVSNRGWGMGFGVS